MGTLTNHVLKLGISSLLFQSYLDSFCKWQKDENPGFFGGSGDNDDPGRWDHGLLLTGLDLYDTSPEYDTVIGESILRENFAEGYKLPLFDTKV